MHRSHLPRSGMALGGIGTGSFEIRQDGSFANWTIFNNQPVFTGKKYPFNPKQSLFFVLRVQEQNENPRLILLQIEDSHGAASLEHHEFHYIFPWLSGVDCIQTTASFPFADLNYEQEGLPLRITLRAWSPFIPGNVKDSALPTAFFDFNIESLSDRPIDVQIVASIRNAVGYDQPTRAYKNRRIMDGYFSAVCMENSQMEPNAQTTGSMTLASLDQDSTAYSGWEHHHPYYEILLKENQLPEIDDTDGRNHLDKTTNLPKADPRCFISIAKRKILAQRGDSLAHCFVLAWYFPNNFGRPINDANLKAGYMEDETFPNHKSNSSKTHDHTPHQTSLEGHYYQHHFNSSEEVARYAAREKRRLLEESVQFHRCFFDSSLPTYVLDQINSQLNTFRTSTWLTRTNMFGVLEGLNPAQSFAGIATTDVAMYGQIATSLLFPELDKMTVDIWSKFQKPNGVVVHSVTCNSQEISPKEATGDRLDMPAQYSFQALRCALWSQNKAYLQQVWPHVKKALAYVLRERDFNNDKCPDMQGIMCSYDNFPMHGVAPYVVSQWLAAISLALVAAKQLSDQIFIDEYQPYLKSGCQTMEEKTWNGKYFNLYSDQQSDDPQGMLGCMSDQIIGDGLVRQLGLPALVDPEKAITALRSIMQMNYKNDQGLRNCQWPGDQFLHKIDKDTWVDQANTCWTGVELNFAAQLFYSGLHEDAFEIIRNVDDRHRKWGMYWDHQEFGGHYFRPMSALAIPGAFLGLSYDGETLCIAPTRPLPVGRWCVILPGAYGTYSQTPDGGKLDIINGKLQVSTVILPAIGNVEITGIKGLFSKKEEADRSLFNLSTP
jgi:non-lysosomal glucosylceramidase